jgi:Kef-type K+ transport system membrane component KefB
MSPSTADFVHLTVAGVLLLAMAHGLGRLFARFRQPRVAGERKRVLGIAVAGNVLPFLAGLAFACLAKSVSCYAGARLTGEAPPGYVLQGQPPRPQQAGPGPETQGSRA